MPPEDVDALATAMRRLIVDAELRQRLGAAAARNVQRFARGAIIAEWDALVAAATRSRWPLRAALDRPARSRR